MSAGSKTYRPWQSQRYRQQAHSPVSKLPEGDLVFFLLDGTCLEDGLSSSEPPTWRSMGPLRVGRVSGTSPLAVLR
jgi:hypothetical protein